MFHWFSRQSRNQWTLTSLRARIHITDGLYPEFKEKFLGKRFKTTDEWLQLAQDVELDMNRRPTQPQQRSHQSHYTKGDHTKPDQLDKGQQNKPNQSKRKPPFPCKF